MALIEEYLSDFFFDVHSVFKGQIQAFLAMICDQSCLNLIPIESRMQGDHEELRILLQKPLISSCFNQTLSLQREEDRFIEILMRKICAIRFAEGALDGCDCAKSVGHDCTTQIPLLLDYCRSIFIGVSTLSHMLIRDSPSVQLNRDCWILLMRSTVVNCRRPLMAMKWTVVHEIYVRSSARLDPMHLERPCHLKNMREGLVLYGENK